MNNFLQKTIFIIALAFWSFISYSQCASHIPYLGNDTTICANETVTLTGYPNALDYSWSTGDSLSNITVDSAGSYWCQSIFMDSTNLVVNGDFEMGDTLFNTYYSYGSGGGWGLLTFAGEYAITTNTNLVHNNFGSMTDHTSGTGNMMVVNGDVTAGVNVWCQTISVTPNTNYVFSAWYSNISGTLLPADNPILEFSINGVLLGSPINVGLPNYTWNNFYNTWTSGPNQTSITICLTNQQGGNGFIDFAIDDIYFAEECIMVDSIQVSLVGPTVILGPDTTICIGDSAHFDISDTIASTTYSWSNGVNTPVFSIDSAYQNLIATATNNGCTDADTINISVLDTPHVVFPADTIMCTGNNFILNMSAPQASYLWHNNYTGNGFFVNQSGTHWGKASNMCGTSSDTVIVTLETPVSINLGNDTTLCNNAQLTLQSNVTSDNYLWSTGSIADSTLVLTANTYALSITNSCGTFSDDITIDYEYTPIIDIGNDTLSCINSLVQIGDTWPKSTYLWSTGATNSLITPSSSNLYWMMATNICGSDTDSVAITYDIPITFNLGPDTTICFGDSILLETNYIGQANWNWSNGSNDSAIWVSADGYYSVTGTNVCGPISDEKQITLEYIPQIPTPIADTAFCVGEIYNVTVPEHNASGILWSDGSTNYDNQFLDSGYYFYTLSNMCGINSDTFYVEVEYPTELSLGSDTTICNGATIIKSFNWPNHTYLWNNGETGSERKISEAGLFGLTVFTPLGCESYDEFVVKSCGAELFVPNAFSPNGDNLNETFAIKGVRVHKYRIVIYDRWGNEVFYSEDISSPWDGTARNKPCTAELYSYRIWYNSGQESESRVYTGTVTLIK